METTGNEKIFKSYGDPWFFHIHHFQGCRCYRTI